MEPTPDCVSIHQYLFLICFSICLVRTFICFNYSFSYTRFYVDDIPIRVFKNNSNIGVDYPSQPMQIEGSLWNGESWATDGGQTKTNWSCAPFRTHFQGFRIDGCPSDYSNCHSSNLWWNQKKFWKLDSTQQKAHENVRNKYMNYDYCSDTNRFAVRPKECTQ